MIGVFSMKRRREVEGGCELWDGLWEWGTWRYCGVVGNSSLELIMESRGKMLKAEIH